MGSTLKVILAGFCLLVGWMPAADRTSARAPGQIFVPVLIYHHVKPLKPSDDAIERGLTVLPAQFEAEIAYLRSHHYHAVSATSVVDALRTGRRLPAHPVVITFDDGYVDVYRNVYPVLRRFRMSATFFIVPGFLNRPRYMGWSQVADMARHGMDIEAHTMTHPDLTLVNAAQRNHEIADSRRMLESRLHRPIRLFAYPYGSYNAAILSAVAHSGYLAAFTTRQGWVARSDQLLTLPRVYVDLDDSPAIFAGRLQADRQVLATDPT